MNPLSKKLKGDIIVWTVLFILSFYSLLAVYSSTGYMPLNPETYMIRQGGLLAAGLALMWVIHKIKWNIALRKLARGLLIFSIFLLICTFFFGVEINGAKRWLVVPLINFQFQTSDVVKTLFVIYLAYIIPKAREVEYTFKKMAVKVFVPIWLVCGLILPMNFSTAAMLFVVSCVMLFVGRIGWRPLFQFLGITFGTVLFVVLISLAFPDSKIVPKRFTTWTTRIASFASDNDEDMVKDVDTYQADQAKIAIVRGGIVGAGPGNSHQRNYLPHPDCDFIFAIIVEEYGLILGAIPIIILYLILLYRGIKISRDCIKPFSGLMVFGIVFLYVIQAFIHIGVCVGLGPVTGQNLPMVSTGGTAMLAFCAAMGLVMSESRLNNKRKAALLAAQQEAEAALLAEHINEEELTEEVDNQDITAEETEQEIETTDEINSIEDVEEEDEDLDEEENEDEDEDEENEQ